MSGTEALNSIWIETCFDDAGGVACHYVVGWNIAANYGSRTNYRSISDIDPRENQRFLADPNIVANHDVTFCFWVAFYVQSGFPEIDKGIGSDPISTMLAAQENLDALGDGTECTYGEL
jgi:hypothetical protein